MRTSLTPAFTSSKMKEMTPFIKECCKSLVIHLNNYLDKGKGVIILTSKFDFKKLYILFLDGKIFETDSKELMTKFANDVIASCTFGIEINSFKEPNNEFFSMAKNLTQIKPWDFIRVTLIVLFPKLSHVKKLH